MFHCNAENLKNVNWRLPDNTKRFIQKFNQYWHIATLTNVWTNKATEPTENLRYKFTI